MKTLFPNQATIAGHFTRLLRQHRNTLDASEVGTGKTVVAAHVARDLGGPVGVLCPKAVIPSWERELAACGVRPMFVTNYEKMRNGRQATWLTKVGKKAMMWHLPFGATVLVDESHKCGAPWTQNAQMLISLRQQNYRVHCMSATAAEDPTEMRALGYVLGLHNLNKTTETGPSWIRWMQAFGCTQDQWGGWWPPYRAERLAPIHEALFGPDGPARRLTVADLPDAFRANRVFVEPVEFGKLADIGRAYDEIGLTPAIVDEFIATGILPRGDNVLVKLLRARQLAEGLKVPDMVEMAKDLLAQHFSTVLFVSFRETAAALAAALDCPVIEGEDRNRQAVIDEFQADRIHCLVVNIAAGGTGVSLHDLHGNRQRATLISPTFSAKQHLQTLGRIHRNGAQSDAIQKILVAAGTVEETVMAAIERKLKNLNTIHGL